MVGRTRTDRGDPGAANAWPARATADSATAAASVPTRTGGDGAAGTSHIDLIFPVALSPPVAAGPALAAPATAAAPASVGGTAPACIGRTGGSDDRFGGGWWETVTNNCGKTMRVEVLGSVSWQHSACHTLAPGRSFTHTEHHFGHYDKTVVCWPQTALIRPLRDCGRRG